MIDLRCETDGNHEFVSGVRFALSITKALRLARIENCDGGHPLSVFFLHCLKTKKFAQTQLDLTLCRAWRHEMSKGEEERNGYQFLEGQHLASSNEKEKDASAEGGSKAELRVEKNGERTAAGGVWIVQKVT